MWWVSADGKGVVDVVFLRVRRHLALAGVASQLMDISAGIQHWPTTLSYWSLHVAEAHYLPPVSLQLITRHWFRRSEHEKKQLGPSCPRDLNQQPRYRLAAAQLPFMSSCCGRVHVKYGTLNKEFYRHEIGPILADELFTAFWQGMAVVVKP